MSSTKSPPWVLFTDRGRPVAILPAGRPGEVANVEHLSMEEAKEIVRLGNELHNKLLMSKLTALKKGLAELREELLAPTELSRPRAGRKKR